MPEGLKTYKVQWMDGKEQIVQGTNCCRSPEWMRFTWGSAGERPDYWTIGWAGHGLVFAARAEDIRMIEVMEMAETEMGD